MFQNKNIFVALTYQCNAFCKKCMTRFHVNLHQTMNRETLDCFLNLLRKYDYKGIISVGTGEPLLYPDLDYFVQELFKINSSVQLRLLTNGMALSRQLPEELFSGRCKLGVTFDAFEQASLNGLQKGVDLETVKENVSRLSQKYDGSCFYLNYTIYQNNINQLLPFCEFGIKNGIHEIYATELKVFTGYEAELKEVAVIHDENLTSVIANARKFLEDNSINSTGLDIFHPSRKAACYLRNAASPIIDVDGSVSFCSGREDIYVGNIKDETIADIWQGYIKKVSNPSEKWCSLCHDRPLLDGTYRLPSTIHKKKVQA